MRVTTIQAPFMVTLYELVRSLNCQKTVFLYQSQFRHGSTHNQAMVPSIAPTPISLPVKKAGRKDIGQTFPVDLSRWTAKFVKQATQAYRKAPNWDKMEKFLILVDSMSKNRMSAVEPSIGAVNVAMTLYMYVAFELDELFPDWGLNNDLNLCNPRPQDPSEYVAACARACDATEYVGGKTAMDAYLDLSKLDGISMFYQDYQVPEELHQYLPHGADARYSALEFLAWIPAEHYPTLLRDMTHEYTKTEL
ncbi:hypothetical protein [Vibrio phage V-YDF132]|nr:hypothetical protein [Vibrio phage V-YDF132]